jgi:hypothetical protein
MTDDIFLDNDADPLFWPETVARARDIEEGLPRLAPGWVGCSLVWLQWASARTKTVKQLVVALLVLRQCRLQRRRTVGLPNGELRLFGITRYAKYRALFRLEQVGVLRMEEQAPGRAVTVTLLDHPTCSQPPNTRVPP